MNTNEIPEKSFNDLMQKTRNLNLHNEMHVNMLLMLSIFLSAIEDC